MTSSDLTTSTGRLAGRTAIVTGSTSGIGAAIARSLADEGASGVVSGRDAARGEAVVKEIREAGGRADVVATDLAGTYAQLRTFASDATTVLGGRVDILVNNAGIGTARPALKETEESFRSVIDVNVLGVAYAIRAVLAGMVARRHGHIVTVGSIAGRIGAPFEAIYAATKFADVGLTEALAVEVAPYGVEVSLVNPGVVATAFAEAPPSPPCTGRRFSISMITRPLARKAAIARSTMRWTIRS